MSMKRIPSQPAIDLYTGLLNARRTKLHPALNAAVRAVGVAAIDNDLQRLVPSGPLNHVASLGLRGERVFPTPVILRHAPPLIGYYRMLLGLSQKEFGQSQRLGYSSWVRAERTGRLYAQLEARLDQFCKRLIRPLTELVSAMGQFGDSDLNDIALLTLGPTLQGGRNNIIGENAALDAYRSVRSLVTGRILLQSPGFVRFELPSGHAFEIIAGTDPDLSVSQGMGTNTIPLIAMEVKGGRDTSNAHNRAGEAEKSHLAAMAQGYQHRWTIIHMAGVSRQRIVRETPTSTEVFDAAEILGKSGPDWKQFRRLFLQLMS